MRALINGSRRTLGQALLRFLAAKDQVEVHTWDRTQVSPHNLEANREHLLKVPALFLSFFTFVSCGPSENEKTICCANPEVVRPQFTTFVGSWELEQIECAESVSELSGSWSAGTNVAANASNHPTKTKVTLHQRCFSREPFANITQTA